MTTTVINAFYGPFADAQKKPWVEPTHPLWNALPFVHLASVPIREMWCLGRDTIMYPPVQIIPGGSIRDGLGPGRLIKGYDMASLQTVPCNIAGVLALSC